MRRFMLATLITASFCISLLSQGRGPVSGDHMKVPPARVPSPYMSAADIQAGLNKLDPKVVSSYAGGAVTIAPGMNAVARRRVTGPQYAITHTREIEYIVVTKGSGTMVTGGTLIPPTIDSDIYPNPDPNATIRSLRGVKDGLARKIGVGDVVINPPGTPHWLSEIDGAIEYVEIRVPNVDPAPGIERAEVVAASTK
jgi:mannose-6-phosphate isomerase-like protein (cupin superfamily)